MNKSKALSKIEIENWLQCFLDVGTREIYNIQFDAYPLSKKHS